jgi:hypothetical protein
VRFVVGSRIHDIGLYRPKHTWQFDDGVTFREVDVLTRNAPAAMTDYLKESEKQPEKPYRKRRERKPAE